LQDYGEFKWANVLVVLVLMPYLVPRIPLNQHEQAKQYLMGFLEHELNGIGWNWVSRFC
jgi:hypothetical protein